MIAERSVVVRTGVELAGPLAVVVATYLFFAGHNLSLIHISEPTRLWSGSRMPS